MGSVGDRLWALMDAYSQLRMLLRYEEANRLQRDHESLVG